MRYPSSCAVKKSNYSFIDFLFPEYEMSGHEETSAPPPVPDKKDDTEPEEVSIPPEPQDPPEPHRNEEEKNSRPRPTKSRLHRLLPKKTSGLRHAILCQEILSPKHKTF